MIDWIVQNIVSIVIVLVIAVLFAVAVISLIRNGKNKRCSCGCEGCIYSSGCKRAVTKDPGIEK